MGGTVYFVYTMDSNIYSVNTSTKQRTTLKETVTNAPIFAADGYVYYTYDVEMTGEQAEGSYELWNAFERVSPAGGEAETVTDKNGRPLTLKYNVYTKKYETDEEGKSDEENDKLAVYKVTPTHVTAAGDVYFTRTEGSKTYIYVMNKDGGIKLLSSEITLTSALPMGYEKGLLGIYSEGTVVVINSDKSIFDEDAASATFSSKAVISGSYTLLGVKAAGEKDFLYYLDSDSKLAKVEIPETSYAEVEPVTLTESTVSSGVYKPVTYTSGGKEFVLFIAGSGDFSSYSSYAYLDGDGKPVEPKYGYIGKLTDSDKERLDTIIEEENED